MDTPRLEPLAVSAAEAARLLGVSRPTVYQLMAREDFPVFRAGKRTLISVEGLREWIAAQAGKGASDMNGTFSLTVIDGRWYREEDEFASVITYDDLTWEKVQTLAQLSLAEGYEVVIDREEDVGE